MASSETRSGQVLELAEEFLVRYRRGERPGLKEYTDRHPEVAGEIRLVFPAMAMMENIAIRDDSLEGDPTDAQGPPREDAALPAQIGDFRIIREIGHGGMGAVYEAEQVSLGRHVALKVLLPQLVRDRKQRLRFEREAKAAAKLHHTNIVPVFGVGEHDGTAYYVMQYIPGLGLDAVIEELRQLRPDGLRGRDSALQGSETSPGVDLSAADMARSLLTGRFERATGRGSAAGSGVEVTQAMTPADGGPDGPEVWVAATAPAAPPGSRMSDSTPGSSSSIVLPGRSTDGRPGRDGASTYWQSVARIGVQVAEALEYAHGQGILHRDIKPSNLLLDDRGSVWVADFGLAKADDQQNLTHTGDILGTLRYMPPEAFEGKSHARSDLYSLGLTLYELLAFRPAFDQKDRARLISQVTREEPVRLSKLNRAIPRDLDTIVHKAIDRDPDHRYASAGELAADLQRFLDDEPIRARRPSSRERLGRWRRRNRGLAAALAFAASALVLGTAASVGMAIRASRYADRAEAAAGEATRALGAARRSEAAEAESARAARAESARQAAARGLSLIDQKDAGRGMLWLVRALELDPEDASGVHHAVRVNLLQAAAAQLSLPRLTLRPAGLQPVEPEKPSPEWVRGLAFSPDGRRMATAHATGIVRIWSTEDGREMVPATELKAYIFALAISPDGRRVWVGCGAPRWQLVTLDVATGRPAGEPIKLPGAVRAFRPDGGALAVQVAANAVRVIDRETGKPLGPVLQDPSHRSDFIRVSFSPDGRTLAMGESNDSETGVSRAALAWEVETGKIKLVTGKHDSYHIYAMDWSPDGRTIATGGHDRILRFWDAMTGAPRGLPRLLPSQIALARYSPDGRTLAVALAGRTSNEFSPSQVRLLDSHTGLPVGPEWSLETGIECLSFSPDGESVAVGLTDGTTRLWALPRANPFGEPLDLLNNYEGIDVRADGLMAFGSASGEVRLSDPATGRSDLLATAKDQGIWGLTFSPDGRTLAIGTGYTFTTNHGPDDAEVWIFDIESRRRICPPIRTGEPIAIAYGFSRDGTILYTLNHDRNRLDLRDAKTGTSLGRAITGLPDVTDTAVDGEDRFALQSDRRGRVVRRDLRSGQPIGEPWALHPDGIIRIHVSPDRHSFATRAADGTVRLWDIESGRALGPPIELESRSIVAVSPDGRTLFIAGWGGDLRFWDARTGLPLGTPAIQGGTYIHGIRFFPAGDRVAIGKDPQIVYVIPVPAALPGATARVRRWAEARAGWTIGENGAVARLSPAEWGRRRDAPDAAIGAAGGESRPSDERDRHLAIAISCMLDHDDFAAVWHLDRVLACGSDETAPWLRRAEVHANLGHTELALGDLERILALDPRRPAEWGGMLKVLSILPAAGPVQAFEGRALSRWQSTTGDLEEFQTPTLVEIASRCGVSRRWDTARALLRLDIDDPEKETDATRGYYSLSDKYVIATVRAGDVDTYRAYCKARFDRVAAGKLKVRLLDFLWECLLAPDGVGDPDALVRMAEAQLKSLREGEIKSQLMRIVGAALYRAGRYDESIARIEESIRMRGGQSLARDWAFLAMAHARQGRRAEALRWLERLPSFKQPEGPDRFWEEQRIGIHGDEARAVVLLDPVFPADPFATPTRPDPSR